MRIRRMLVGFLLCFYMSGVLGGVCFAYTKDKTFSIKDVTTWSQTAFPESASQKLADGSGESIGSSACSYFSMSYALVKGGYIDPSVTSPIDIINKVDIYGGWDTTWGHFNGTRISELESDLTCYKYMMTLGGNADEAWSILKNLYNQGYYLQVCLATKDTKGHYIFIDGWDDSGECYIGDSGFSGTKWSDYYKDAETTFSYVNVYKSKSGNGCNTRPSIYGTGVKTTNATLSLNESSIYEKMTKEWELVGMPKQYSISDVYNKLPTQTELNLIEKQRVDSIRINMVDKKITVFGYARIGVSFLGICVLLYGVLLMVSFIFDVANTLIGISLISLITLGRCRFWEKDCGLPPGRNKSDGKFYIDLRHLIVYMVVLSILGICLINGAIFSFISILLSKVRSFVF